MKKCKPLVVPEHLTRYFISAVLYCYLERENYKVLKFNVNSSSYFKILP